MACTAASLTVKSVRDLRSRWGEGREEGEGRKRRKKRGGEGYVQCKKRCETQWGEISFVRLKYS